MQHRPESNRLRSREGDFKFEEIISKADLGHDKSNP